MKRISIIAAVLGAIILAFTGVAIAAPATGSTTCTDNSLASKTITSNVTVPAGARCDLSWADVQGNVTVNGTLVTYGITHFAKNVQVNAGGSFAAANWGVTIDGNLSITDPAANSGNGFWGDYSPNLVKGNLNYTITPTAAAAYPQYQWPYLYFGGPTEVNGNVTYSVGALSSVRPFNQGTLTVDGNTNVS
jgi:hypothetical protein